MSEKRKMASIQIIEDIKEIPGALNVELVRVLGWNILAVKNQFKVGQLAVFYEVDSIVPDQPVYEFLRPRNFRIKIMKSPRLGVISQGLLMPITDVIPEKYLSDEYANSNSADEFKNQLVGRDVTELLGVEKYEIP